MTSAKNSRMGFALFRVLVVILELTRRAFGLIPTPMTPSNSRKITDSDYKEYQGLTVGNS
jgi:hypothetical protein